MSRKQWGFSLLEKGSIITRFHNTIREWEKTSVPLLLDEKQYAAADQDWQRAIDIIRENDIPRSTK